MGVWRRIFGGSGGDEPSKVYGHCWWCQQPIMYGEDSVSISKNVERASEASIEVMDSNVVLALCASCGGHLDPDSLRQALDAQRPE